MAIAFLTSAAEAIRRRLGHRKRYLRSRDWALSLYDALLRYCRHVPMPLRRSVRAVRLKELQRPVYLRLGSSDGFVIEEIFITGVYDHVDIGRPDQVRLIVDLGANAGYSVRLWRHRYPNARVIAVEPDAGNVGICRMNAEDGAGMVQIVPACVAGRDGWVYLDRTAPQECAFKMADRPINGGDRVLAMTLPQVLEQCGVDGDIDLLKCDIEGAEREMFADCAGWLPRVRNLMIELHPPYGRQNLLADLARAGGRFQLAWGGITAGNELLFLTCSP